MKGSILVNQFEHHIKIINAVFDIQSKFQQNSYKNIVKNYYKNSAIAYKWLHSKEGSLHMALNFDGKFDEDGFYEQARIIQYSIEKYKYVKNVLELGCGRGFNTKFLAQKSPNVSFNGIDIVDDFILENKKHVKNISNLNFKIGDFHEIPFQNKSFDLVYEIEAVCNTQDTQKVLREIFRVLKSNGLFILFDGFRQSGFDELDSTLKEYSKIVETSMALSNLSKIDYWIQIAQEIGFEVILQVDISFAIMPNLIRLQNLSKKYFKYRHFVKVTSFLLPKSLVMNSIAGLLMPFTFGGNAHGYYQIILRRP